MTSYLQLIGTSTGDSHPSILLFFDTIRYLINSPEGLQRFCFEHHIRVARVEHILITRVAYDTCGGLPGLLLTLADCGVKQVTIHGPQVRQI